MSVFRRWHASVSRFLSLSSRAFEQFCLYEKFASVSDEIILRSGTVVLLLGAVVCVEVCCTFDIIGGTEGTLDVRV